MLNLVKQDREMFLGQLYPEEGHKVYGWTTSTRITFVIVYGDEAPVKDGDVRVVFRRLHDAYAKLICNPFYDRGTPITSR